ncbi:aminotransferase [Cordyceps fumosorosea ARSEF 2679]|uniref:Aminotransferase n=1 Tax=Cordyceps fumosorosea (strain ARSEF 2679) TaxID=1081104 RepID=A0A167VUG8_CORFA|nr:aminotransferase [Cordyceps fumosorosea ARSEF 2679]OAA62990.1 aminotransferase [Cordyceps fumosorosea ARSEF 2679]
MANALLRCSYAGMARTVVPSYARRYASTAATALPVDDRPVPTTKSAVLHRNIKNPPLQVVAANGTRMRFSNGHEVEDSTVGASVACLGHGNKRVRQAMIDQMDKFSYCNSIFFGHQVGEDLATELINGTGGAMARAYILSSGSEAMDAAMKMARQYFMELNPKQPNRINFIAREGSYHGTTIGGLSMSGHVARRSLFLDMLLPNVHRVSSCNAYRGMKPDQTTEEYVEQLADELDRKFQQVGPETVCAFVAEPVVGAALGCVPAVPGYFKAMRRVCDKYGALLILDEVMSGMGRCGSLHVWQQEGVVPDIETMAKGLGGGYAPVAGMMVNHRIADALMAGTGAFLHGHTYQGHPIACAAALEVQRIVREDNLVENVKKTGKLLGRLLHQELDSHPNVGNVRGKGLFWGIEFVRDKESKTPFPVTAGIANAVHTTALMDVGIMLYPGMGSMNGVEGDHVLVSPAYTVTEKDIEGLVRKIKDTIDKTFAGM